MVIYSKEPEKSSTPSSAALLSGPVLDVSLFKRSLIEIFDEPSYNEISIRQMTRYWHAENFLICISMMLEYKPLEEWYDSPWEIIFEKLLVSIPYSSGLEEYGLVVPEEFWRRAVNRTSDDYLEVIVGIKEVRPFVIDRLEKRFDGKDSDLEDTFYGLLEEENLTLFELERLWRLALRLNRKGIYNIAGICEVFLQREYFPESLVRELLTSPPAGSFTWRLLNNLSTIKHYGELLDEFGGLDYLATTLVDNKYGNWSVVTNDRFSNRTRVLAALQGYSWHDVSTMKGLNKGEFDLKAETILLLREEAEQAGLSPDLPVRFLLETLWEPGSPGWFYITGESRSFS